MGMVTVIRGVAAWVDLLLRSARVALSSSPIRVSSSSGWRGSFRTRVLARWVATASQVRCGCTRCGHCRGRMRTSSGHSFRRRRTRTRRGRTRSGSRRRTHSNSCTTGSRRPSSAALAWEPRPECPKFTLVLFGCVPHDPAGVLGRRARWFRGMVCVRLSVWGKLHSDTVTHHGRHSARSAQKHARHLTLGRL